jgi:hypothetical protein
MVCVPSRISVDAMALENGDDLFRIGHWHGLRGGQILDLRIEHALQENGRLPLCNRVLVPPDNGFQARSPP